MSNKQKAISTLQAIQTWLDDYNAGDDSYTADELLASIDTAVRSTLDNLDEKGD